MTTYRFGPFQLLPDQRRLERGGAAVPMTPKAFDLLVALVRHRARAVSKDELLELVWAGASVEEGNLAQQVLLLRRALADAGESVATVPRHGYRFVAPVVEENDANRDLFVSPHCLIWNDREIPLREGITLVGRAEDADLRIPLPSVSRHHARILVRGLEATLEDLGSRHGTWRGTLRLRSAITLAQGDELRLGNAVMEYRLVMPRDTTHRVIEHEDERLDGQRSRPATSMTQMSPRAARHVKYMCSGPSAKLPSCPSRIDN